MRRALAVGSFVALLTSSAPVHGEIYRWVDENGVTHLADNIEKVPEASRESAKVFQSKTRAAAPAPAVDHGPTQSAFANAVARELGLVASDTQDPVSALYIVGIYPGIGWNPAATLTSAVVDEVTRSARAAARARRLPQGEASVEASVLRVATNLGVPGPPPTVVAAPAPPPEPPTVVVAPNIVVESPPTNVVVQNIEPRSDPVLTRYGWDPLFGGGVPYAPIAPGPPGPIPDRITPLSNPAGRLRGPAVPPRPGPQPFRRPLAF